MKFFFPRFHLLESRKLYFTERTLLLKPILRFSFYSFRSFIRCQHQFLLFEAQTLLAKSLNLLLDRARSKRKGLRLASPTGGSRQGLWARFINICVLKTSRGEKLVIRVLKEGRKKMGLSKVEALGYICFCAWYVILPFVSGYVKSITRPILMYWWLFSRPRVGFRTDGLSIGRSANVETAGARVCSVTSQNLGACCYPFDSQDLQVCKQSVCFFL